MLKKNSIVYLTYNQNNILSNIILENQTNFIISSGCVGFKKASRNSKYASKALIKAVINFLRRKRKTAILLILRGVQNKKNKKNTCKTFIEKKIRILAVLDRTNFSFNGCRTQRRCHKKRRTKKSTLVLKKSHQYT